MPRIISLGAMLSGQIPIISYEPGLPINKIFSKNPKWAVINVTNKPIEEIASEILAIKGKKVKKI